jgi:glycosyltransferase involved in cell wall biosynthesis
MELADLVLVPSRFAEGTIREFHPGKEVAMAAYGVDLEFWQPDGPKAGEGPLRFVYAGQLSLRKGIPLLLQAWEAAALPDAELELVGLWQLAEAKRTALPRGVRWLPAVSRETLRDRYRAADAFVFPSFFEGFGLVLLEAMACGLPAIASDATAGPDVLVPECGRVIPAGNLDALVAGLEHFGRHRAALAGMGLVARAQAARCTWENYRRRVTESVARYT